MSETRRQDAATATVGLGGVAGAGALRHVALERAYSHSKRPKLLQELRLFKRGSKGRRLYAAGATLGAVATPAAAVGTAGTFGSHVDKADTERHSFLRSGVAGVKNSLVERNDTITHPAPVQLQAANYGAGLGIGSGTGALVHHKLTKHKFPGSARSGLAAAAGVGAAAATLPLQSKVMGRLSGNKYEVTATGVRRKKHQAVRPSHQATTVDARPGRGDPRATRAAIVPSSVAKMGEGTAARLNTRLNRIADRIGPIQDRPVTRKGRLKATGRSLGSEAVRGFAADPSVIRYAPHVSKADNDPGASLTHAQKRRRVAAVAGPPIIGDIAQAGQAARLAPPGMRKQTAALQYGGNQVGGTAGTAAGAYGAAALARHNKTFRHGSVKASDAIDAGKAKVRSAVGMKPKTGPGLGTRMIEHKSMPGLVKRMAKPLLEHPKVAALGGLVAGAVGGVAGGQTGYGIALNREDKYRVKVAKSSQSARHGSRVAKTAFESGESMRQRKKAARQKTQSAVLSAAGGSTGLASLTALGTAKLVSRKHPAMAGKLRAAQMPLLTVGGGLGGLNAFKYAGIQRKEAKALRDPVIAAKAYLSPATGTVVRRAPTIRSAAIRQTRTSTGVKTSTVRGSLG